MTKHLLLLVAFSIFVGASGRAEELGVPSDSACIDILKNYLNGEKGLYAPCDEGNYETIMAPATTCPKVVKQRAQRAQAVCSAIKATQRDYDDCNQTDDVDRALAGCIKIINDKSQAVADRAAAYVQRGNAVMVNDYRADAMESYKRAIKLDPRSVVAYAARAIANWKDADIEKENGNLDWERKARLQAVADYRQAGTIDAEQTKEMTAASAELQKISAAATKGVPALPKGWRPPPRGG